MSRQWAKHQVESKYYSGSLWRSWIVSHQNCVRDDQMATYLTWLRLLTMASSYKRERPVPVCHNNRWGEGGGGGRQGNQATWGNHHVNHCLPTVSIDKYYHSGDHSTAPSDHCHTRLANDSILAQLCSQTTNKWLSWCLIIKVKMFICRYKLYFLYYERKEKWCFMNNLQPSNPNFSVSRLL